MALGIYVVLGVFRVVLSTIVFWLRWQVRKPNRTVTLCSLLKELLGKEEPAATIIYGDNQGAIALAKNTKYIAMVSSHTIAKSTSLIIHTL